MLNLQQCIAEIYNVVLGCRNALSDEGQQIDMEELIAEYQWDDVIQLFLEDMFDAKQHILNSNINKWQQNIINVYRQYGYIAI
jgi:hypothetical protein